MNCPACGKTLSPVKQGELTLDVCNQGCGGIWFDAFELKKVDEESESSGEALLNPTAPHPIQPQSGVKRSCPKCKTVKMFPHYFSVRQQVQIDECGGCGGVWLDLHELASIRRLFKTEADRKKAFEDYFQGMFSKDLAAAKAEGQEKIARHEKFAKAVRFVLPSYWIPGKQPWGAF